MKYIIDRFSKLSQGSYFYIESKLFKEERKYVLNIKEPTILFNVINYHYCDEVRNNNLNL